VTGGWRKLHNEGVRDLHYSPSKIRIVKSKKMRCGACGLNEGEQERTEVTVRTARRKEATKTSKT
jgi:hypothetical protein